MKNQWFPSSLSKNGDLRSGIKSDILTCFEDIHHCSLEKRPISCVILHGPIIVNMLPPINCSAFRDYSSKFISPFICCHLESCNRIDIVWDVYKENTIKASVRRKKVQEQAEEFCQFLRFQVTGILFYELMRTRRNCSSFRQLKHPKWKTTRKSYQPMKIR